MLASFGYTAYLIVFYLLSGMLFVSVALCFWVAWCFKNDTFPFLWPIKFLRVVVSLFFGMLYIAALNIFLSNLECYDKYGNGVWYHHMFKDSTGSYVKCFSTPHLIHIIIAAVSSVTFAVVAMLLFTAEHELEPMTRNLLASPHSMCELRVMGAKTIIVCADILLWNYPKIQGVAFVLCCYAMTFWSLRMVPQYVSWVNCLRSALFAALTWIAAHLCVLTFLGDCVETRYAPIENEFTCTNWGQIKMLTYSLFIGVTPAALLGGALAYGRMYWFFRIARRFVNYEAGMNSKRVWRFSHEFDVELAARMIGRCWDEDDNYDPQALDLAETILKGGLQQFPDSAYLHIVYANFLIEVRGQGQAGWQHLETARKCHPNLSYKFSIFTREQEHKQKSSAGAAGEGSVDLVSFVEFQRNQRMLIAYHKQALVATRDFWRLLMRERVNLRALTAAFRKIDKMESMADKTYKVRREGRVCCWACVRVCCRADSRLAPVVAPHTLH